MTGPRVVYWSNIPAPYMVERFDAVARRGNLAFEAWFSARTEEGRSWRVDERSWGFPYFYLPGARGRWHSFILPPRLLRGRPPDVFVSLYASPAFLVGSWLARRRGARTAFWLEATGDAVTRRTRWKEALKSAVLPKADAILTTGEDGRRFASRYAVRDDRILVVPHVVDFSRYAQAQPSSFAEQTHSFGPHAIRDVKFIYVGKLSLAKGLDYLLDAFTSVTRSSEVSVSLLLVGDGPDEAYLRERCAHEGLTNVFFSGFQHPEPLARLYGEADVFVFPTLGDTFGMVVSEAMASGLPVIATSAAGEIRDRVSDGVSGFVVPPADLEELTRCMTLLAEDSPLRQAMGAESRARMEGESPDDWAIRFEAAIARILSLPRASRVVGNL